MKRHKLFSAAMGTSCAGLFLQTAASSECTDIKVAPVFSSVAQHGHQHNSTKDKRAWLNSTRCFLRSRRSVEETCCQCVQCFGTCDVFSGFGVKWIHYINKRHVLHKGLRWGLTLEDLWWGFPSHVPAWLSAPILTGLPVRRSALNWCDVCP